MGSVRTATVLALLLLAHSGPAVAQVQDPLRGSITDEPQAVFESDPTDAPPDEQVDAVPEAPTETRITVGPDVEPVDEIEEEQPRRRQRQRDTDPFAPLGIRAGGFLLFPTLEVGGTVTDNVRQTKHDRKADVGLRLEPALVAESQWVRHSLRLSAAGDFTFYRDEEEYNRRALNASSELRLQVRNTTALEYDASYRLSQTSSSDVEVPDNAVGERQDQSASVSAAVVHRFNRLEATVRGGASGYLYGDVDLANGGVESNSDRDYVEPLASLKLAYETSASLTPFVEGGYTPRIHRDKVDRNGFRRDSEGGFVRLGTAFAFSEIWDGEVAFRVDTRSYDDPSLKSQTMPGFDANVTWRPTRMTTVRFTGETSLNETSLAGISAVRTYDVAAEVNHMLRENVRARGSLGFSYDDYPGSAIDEWTLQGNFDLSYILRRDMELVLSYEYTLVESNDPGDGYTENRITAGIRFRL